MKTTITGIIVSLIATSSFADSLTVEKLTQLNRIHDVVVSPDGSNLVYGLKDPQSGENHLYLTKLNSKKSVSLPLTSHKTAEHNVRFSADGKAIYFLSNRSGTQQIWRLNLAGGEAQQLSFLPVDIQGFKISNDGSGFALSINTLPSCETLNCIAKAKLKSEQAQPKVKAYDQLMVRHWDTWLNEFQDHLFWAKLNEQGQITDAVDLMPNWQSDIAGISEVAIKPDGLSLVFSAKAPAKDHAWTTNFDLFEVNLKTHEINNITSDNKAWDASPVYSNDGRFLAYKAMKTPGYESDKFSIKVRDNLTGRLRSIADNWDRSVMELTFARDNRTLIATAQDLGQRSIFTINPEFGDVRKIVDNGYAGNIQSAGDEVFFTRHSLDKPTDVYRVKLDGYDLTQITHVNQQKLADVEFAEFEQFSFKGWNNESVYGYWLKPVDFQQGQKYPIAFLVHGGPQGSFGNMFHFRWNAQLWAAQGYGVVMIDFHGSTGYGQAFTDSIARDWGGKPLEDLQKGFEYITQTQPWLDETNACALGASFGGYMMNWIEGNWPEQFKCIVNHAGLFDMPSFYNTTEELWFPEHDLGGPVWRASEDYQKFNPAAYVNHWKTPMLVLQGENDFRVPYAQSLGAFTTLQRKGIDSRLVVFPRENHHIRQPKHLIRWYQEVFDWLKKYTSQQP